MEVVKDVLLIIIDVGINTVIAFKKADKKEDALSSSLQVESTLFSQRGIYKYKYCSMVVEREDLKLKQKTFFPLRESQVRG